MKNNCTLLHRGRRLLAAPLAMSFFGILLTGCDKKDKIVEPPALAITSFSPAEAAEGASVVIKGVAFLPDKTLDTVRFNGLVAVVTAAKTDELTVTVPEEATTGKITVTVGTKTVTSATDFKVNPTAPVISAIAPEKGDVGTVVEITGDRFTSSSKIYFGGIEATEVVFVSKTKLTAKVPAGALNGKLKIIANNLEAVSAADFWVKPTIGTFTAKAGEGEEIEINGTNFSTVPAENSIYFGEKAATEITYASATQLKVKVPAGLNVVSFIKVVVKDQEATAGTVFSFAPTLTSFSPEKIERGKVLTITGKNFDGTMEVLLNGKKLFLASSSATKLEVYIPDNATDGKIVVVRTGVDREFATPVHIFNYWQVFDDRTGGAGYSDGAKCFVYNNKIYKAFGNVIVNSSWTANDKVYSYDPASKSWNFEFSIPSKVTLRRYHFSVVKDNKWYFGGGDGGDRRTCWVMDLTKSGDDAWTQLKSLPTGSMYDEAFVLNNEIYAALTLYEKAVYRYDVASNNWIPVMSADISYMGSVFTINNKAWLTNYTGAFYEFDPAATALVATGNVPENISFNAPMFSLNGKGYCGGSNSLYEYNPADKSWTKKCAMPYDAQDLEVSVLNNRPFAIRSDGRVYEYIAE